MRTDDLIEQLAREAGPVRRLPAPGLRAAHWLAVALPAVALVVLLMSPRPDLAVKLVEARFLFEQTAALVTAMAAAVAAFHLVVPGAERRFLWLPLAPLAIWGATLGAGCVADWMRQGPEGLRLAPDLACFPSIALVGVIPAAAIVVMLRRAMPVSPFAAAAFGGLAAAALGNFGLRFFHYQDAALMVLVWQFGSVLLLSLLAGIVGSRILEHARPA